MASVWPFRRTLGWLLVSVPLCAGCGDSNETGPAPEPAKGPEAPAGGGETLKAPPLGPATKAERGAADKAVEKK